MKLLEMLAQVAPGTDPIQWHAPVANDVEWYYIVGAILVGSALVTSGLGRILRYSLKGYKNERLLELAGRTFLCIVCAGLGAVAGWRTWDWPLGAVVGFVGSCAAPVVLKYFYAIAGKWLPKPKDNGAGNVERENLDP
jgi:hypothetical protein